MMEGVGHISLGELKKYVKLIREKLYVHFMPLGPIPTDRAIGWGSCVCCNRGLRIWLY